jgi:drug/metabolite transporter superfamily protein YnfA
MGYRALYLAIPGILLILVGLLWAGGVVTAIGGLLIVLAVVIWPLLTADERPD